MLKFRLNHIVAIALLINISSYAMVATKDTQKNRGFLSLLSRSYMMSSNAFSSATSHLPSWQTIKNFLIPSKHGIATIARSPYVLFKKYPKFATSAALTTIGLGFAYKSFKKTKELNAVHYDEPSLTLTSFFDKSAGGLNGQAAPAPTEEDDDEEIVLDVRKILSKKR